MSKLNLKIFSQRLQFARIMNKNMTQSELAKKCHCSQQKISQMEKAKIEPDFSLINSLSDALGFSVEWLLGLVDFYHK
jgi:transcriptional regulator with XRE-family HTH domain